MFGTKNKKIGIPMHIPVLLFRILGWASLVNFETVTYEPPHGKTNMCICENKDAEQLRGNREADQRLCFQYTDSTLPLLLNLNPKFQASSLLL